MADYIPCSPITVREHAKFTVTSDGVTWFVDGNHAPFFPAKTIIDNDRHYLRSALTSILPTMRSGEIAGVVVALIDGKSAQIIISREQYSAIAGEVARFSAWQDDCMASEKRRQSAERSYDRGMNEGGEGYNPYRMGSAHTYRR